MSLVDIVYEYRQAYLEGLLVTLKLCGVAWVGGLALGSLIAMGAEWWPRLLGLPVSILSRVTEAIPILVLLFWLHYPIQAASGVTIDPFLTTALLLTVLNSLAVFGVLRRALSGVPLDLVEAAYVCGVDQRRTFWRIKVPLAMRSAVGSITSAQVNVLQLSIFGSLISVGELFRTAQRINAEIYRPVEVYTGVALFFLAVCLPLNVLAGRLDRRWQ